ncbi:MAG: phosphoribosyl-ATP diphosphatase [Erythrobacter sp.]|uniref:phosphoribosyl-ATP diphosphatase n=1 Tax=Erythrobacter sp. TaxID=1042 RepID=UPI003C71D289
MAGEGTGSAVDTIARLEATIAARRDASPDESYVAGLRAAGLPAMAQKVGEEATESVIAALAGSKEDLTAESADLLFHLLVLLAERGIAFDAVLTELDRREGLSGLAEKASRKE